MMIGEERSEEATEAACVHNKNTIMFRICPNEEMNLTYCVFCSLKIFCIDFLRCTHICLLSVLVLDGGAVERSGSALSHLDAAGWKDLDSALPSPLEDSLRQAATCKFHLQWGDTLNSGRLVLFQFKVIKKIESEINMWCGFVFLSAGCFEKSQNDNVAVIVKCSYQQH